MAAIKPLLFISDAVSAPTGLARITRDLAQGVHESINDLYRVATFGYGGPGNRSLGFQQYAAENVEDFILGQLPDVWTDFAGDEKGVVMCVWDTSRLAWLASPRESEKLNAPKYRGLMRWLEHAPFEKWLYCPVDASGPNDRMTFPLMKTLQGFDRIIAYSEWGKAVIERTIGPEKSAAVGLHALPHGIRSDIFTQAPSRRSARRAFPSMTQAVSFTEMPKPIEDDEILIGIVATNQARKDWPLGIETAAILAQNRRVRLWLHIDSINRNWDIIGLLIDYGLLGDRSMISTGHLSDMNLARAYSACDLTIGIGPEGFGYPIFESVFCGTPCIHGNYGGAPEHLSAWPECLVEPVAFRIDGVYSQRRPVYRACDFANAAERMIGKRVNRPGHLDWSNLWPRWESWFRAGAEKRKN